MAREEFQNQLKMTKEQVIAALESMRAPVTIEIVSEARSEENQATVYVFNFSIPDGTSICVVYDNEDVIFTPLDWQAMQPGFSDGLEALDVLADEVWLSYHAGLNLRRRAVVMNGFPKIFVQ